MTLITQLERQHDLEPIAPLGRIGLVALATDCNSEQDLRRMYPEGVEIFTSRVRNYNPLSIKNLRTMEPGIEKAAADILPGTPLDAIIYGCTSGSVAIGSERIEQLIHQAQPGVPVTNPFVAIQAAFRHFQAQRISVLTPYTSTVNEAFAKQLTQAGFQVLNVAGFGMEDDTAMTFIQPDDLMEAALKTCAPDADLLFISCTSLRTSLVHERIEKRLNKPVISSNQALVWHSLQLIGYNNPLSGFGQLLAQPNL